MELQNKNLIKKVSYLGIYISLALIFSYLETMIQVPIPVPGVKLGITNLVIVVLLYKIGAKEAAAVNLLRVIIIFLLFGNLLSFIYSLSGAFFSLLIMILTKKTNAFSIYGVCISGSVVHNIAQIMCAYFLIDNINIVLYLPVLLLSGLVCGFIIAFVSDKIIKRLDNVSSVSIM